MIKWWAKFVVNHPCKIITVIALFCTSTVLIPYYIGHVPQVLHPKVGFETRGTEIAKRVVTWENLIKTIEQGVDLIDDLTKISSIILPKFYEVMKMGKKDADELKNLNGTKKSIITSEERNKLLPYLKQMINNSIDDTNDIFTLLNNKTNWKSRMDFFCSKPTYDHARVVFTANAGENLLTFQTVMDMCAIQQNLEDLEAYKDICDEKDHRCCPPWSLVNYITLLSNYDSCTEIQPSDINMTMTLLQQCASYYHNNEMSEWTAGFKSIPHQCLKFNAVYNLMHYHLDINFMQPNIFINDLKSSLMFLPFEKGPLVDVYKAIQDSHLSTELVSISAIDFGIKKQIFDLEVVEDIYLILFSTSFIVLCIMFYTRSLVMTFATLLNVIFSISFSYFIYTFIFRINFFPFLNFLVIIVLVGISTNSSFIIDDVWKAIQTNDIAESLVDVIYKTLKHSMLFISLSTTTTFCILATLYLSAINGISCFGIFSVISIFVNLLMTVSLLPACIVLLSFQNRSHVVLYEAMSVGKLQTLRRKLRKIKTFFHTWLLKIIYRFHWSCIIFLCILGLLSIIVICIWPGIKLSESMGFQLFKEDHPFEQYDLIYKNEFWFERILKIDTNPKNPVPLRFVWGVLPNDNGNHLNPDDRGNLIYDPDFDIANPKSQIWLLEFCSNLRVQSFFGSTGGPQLTNCFIETFVKWMDHPCIEHTKQNSWPCCNAFEFPYPNNIFNYCILKSMYDVYNSPSTVFVPSTAGPKFSNLLHYPSNQTFLPLIKTIVVEFESNFDFTTSYKDMDNFYKNVESWLNTMMETAPPGLTNGWFYSHLGFYDLQKMLINDTIKSAFITFIIIFFIMLCVTNNVSSTIMMMFTTFLIICTTIGVLVLFGWRLDILESIATSIAISLSMNFSQYYILKYQIASQNTPRATAISRALSFVACPSLMSAITTGISGVFMLPSDVLPYTYLGIFLVTVMSISWVYSTFFLVSLLTLCGSKYTRSSYSCICCHQFKNEYNTSMTHTRCTRQASLISNVGSDSTLSCISSVNQLSSYEMETLTVQTLKSPDIGNNTSCVYLGVGDIDNDEDDVNETNIIHI